jgi:hypothetical protein
MTQAEVEEHIHEMRMAGMNGCVGSTDATHIVWHRCSYWHWQSPLGYKISQTAWSYILTMIHHRRILSSTNGHPAAHWNDKTLVLYDDFAHGKHEGKCLSEVEFVLLERDSTGNIVEHHQQTRSSSRWEFCDILPVDSTCELFNIFLYPLIFVCLRGFFIFIQKCML